jgi:hypothetical protein
VVDTPLRKLDSADDFSLPSLFDQDYLYPGMKEVMPRLEALAERLYARGGGQMVPSKTVLSRIFSQNVGNWIRTHGFGWEQEIRQNIFRMFGHDDQAANMWMRRLREELRVDDTAPTVVALRREIREADDSLRALEDEARP